MDRLTLIKLLQSTHFVVNKSIQQRIDDASYLSSIAWNSLAADEQTDRPKVKQVSIVVIIFWGLSQTQQLTTWANTAFISSQ